MTNLESRLGEAMRASVATVQPTFTAADVRRRHDGRVRRQTAMGLAVAMAMAVLAFFLPRQLGRVDAASMTVEPLAGHTTSYTDPAFGWTITYNRGLVEGRSARGRKPDVVEAVRFTNFTAKLRVSGPSSVSMGWLRAFPASGVALQVWTDPGMQTHPPAHDTAFPLEVASFAPVRKFAGGSEPTPLYQVFYGDGVQFRAAVWIGRMASRASEQAIWAAVRSVRFPSLRTGTVWQDRFYVLGLKASYRVDSVTLFAAAALPRGSLRRVGFYLVRSSRDFYVVQRHVLVAELHVVNLVRYDTRRRQFFSPGTVLRWSLDGSPVGQIANPALQIDLATVCQGGRVLYAPDLDEYSAAPTQLQPAS